jgi:hypothetical protein
MAGVQVTRRLELRHVLQGIGLKEMVMLRGLALLILLFTLAWSLREVFSDPKRPKLRLIGWGILSVALIVAGIWIIVGDV